MSLGASEDWRTVLKAITGETELSTKGILEYFDPLEKFLRQETVKVARNNEDMDKNAPIVVGIIIIVLILLIIVVYCVKKKHLLNRTLSMCGLTKNGSLDIVTNEMTQRKSNEADGVSEEKV